MTLSPLTKIFLPAVIFSGVVFSAMTLPLALMGSEQISIKLHEDPVFQGKVRDIASPYLALTTLLSIATGIATASTIGWRQSKLESSELEQQVSKLQQNLQGKEELLKELKLSQPRLQAFGLGAFLEDEPSVVNRQHLPIPVPQPAVAETSVPVVAATVIPPQPQKPVPTIHSATAQAAAVFPSAQTFRAYGKVNIRVKPDVTTVVTVPVEDMQKQLREMIAQMQAIQTALQATSQSEVMPANFYVDATNPSDRQVQFLEPRQVQRVAS